MFTKYELQKIEEAKKTYPEYTGIPGNRFKDLTGQKFNELTVLYRYKYNQNKKVRWVCLCSCGNICVVCVNNLPNNHTKHCGDTIHRIRKNLSGEKFGRLNVVKYYGKIDDEIFYECICDCQLCLPKNEQKYILVRAKNLSYGTAKSCGCLQKEIASKSAKVNSKKYNKYDLESKEYGIGYTVKGEKFLFDKEDYDLIKDKYWHFSHGYVVWTKRIDSKTHKQTRMHNLIQKEYGWETNCEIDHINGNRADNRKENLRTVTKQQNRFNHGIASNNTSGCTGVGYEKRCNKWKATIIINKKSIWLGRYEKYEDAVKARKAAEEKYFGEFARRD